MKLSAYTLLAACGAGLIFHGCGSDDDSGGSAQAAAGSGGTTTFAAPWPANLTPILSTNVYTDPPGDLTISHPGDAPPSVIPFPPADVTQLSFGVDGDFLYLRIELAAALPIEPVSIAASPGVAPQTVSSQSFSLVVDGDSDDRTGGGASPWEEGVDLFFAVKFTYGREADVYVNYDFLRGDLHLNQGQAYGELGAGGPGFDYVVVRYDISRLPPRFLPRGQTAGIGSWTEAESELYHEMAADSVIERASWSVPQG